MMRVVVTCERHLIRTPDGTVCTTSESDYHFWERFLAVFDEVLIVGRMRDDASPESTWKPVNGPRVAVAGLPDYEGPLGYLRHRADVLYRLRQVVHHEDAVVLRIPSHVATSVETILRFRRQPYAAEVVGDISAALAPGSVDSVLRPVLHPLTVRMVRRQCRNACAIAYVTAHTLQQYYPPSPQAFVTNYSSIELPDQYIMLQPRVVHGSQIKIISVGSMAKKYKRFDLLIQAVRRCLSNGLDLRLTLVGDGHFRKYFEDMACGLDDRVEFVGELPGSDAVREQLLKADLFVLASINEGLPRVVIEAMAAGLPCIATTVGGTPELLPAEDMVPMNDEDALAAKIQEVSTNPERMRAMSTRNLEVARRYVSSELRKRRQAMYRYLRTQTEERIEDSGRN